MRGHLSRDVAVGGKTADALEKKAEDQKAVAEVSGFQVVFKIPGRVSVGASEGAKSLYISNATISPDLVVRSVPVMDPDGISGGEFHPE